MCKNKKIILITGCSSGFGFLATKQFSQVHTVIATFRNRAVFNDLKSQFGKAVDLQYCDVCSEESVKLLISYVQKQYGYIDVLINNAGVFLGGFFEDYLADEVKWVMDTNVSAVFKLTKCALPLIRQSSHGKIINMSSSSGLVAMPAASIYAASKHAIEGWSEALSYELAPFGISVSCVEPQTYDTAMLRKNLKLTAGKDNSNSVYFHFYKPLIDRVFSRKKVGRDPVEVIAVLEKIVNAKKPKLRYLVGPSTQLKFYLKYLLPFEFFYKLVNMIFLKIVNKKTIKHVAA